ncbi:LOW QUALITY PROTEIN: atrial natriuretic peptide receptor 1 [Thrips palmi]|uniref:Guanylate cyclase n=1 Tax=Thrips palmi TaxID=161013 RepID=A0A6P8ZIU7_THRPL|nr:LOW QUALITY PROTEIN: atrial natriuretic peptide receptor 1 [Thrips palmi]
MDLAIKDVSHPADGILPGWSIALRHRDSQCSSTYGPLAAFDFVMNKTVDAFFGPICDYVIAPVVRYSSVWNIPVLTGGGQAENFAYKENFPVLTRMQGSFGLVGETMKGILHEFGWKVVGLLFHNNEVGSSQGNSPCYFTGAAVYKALNSTPVHHNFNENTADPEKLREHLVYVTGKARIVVVCANPSTVREIMLAAEELNMVDSGEYVFFNIELFSSMDRNRFKPWHAEGDTDERNARARKAYSALLTVTARTPDNESYRNFSNEVKEVAREKYNYTFGPAPVSAFVSAFYDAVLLYALALNETVEQGGDPHDGKAITERMWNRTFNGISGDVKMDSNGDRIADYSLLDMDPETGEFKIVANYIGGKHKLEYVEDRQIHWSGGRTTPPADTPLCGFDGSLCPDNALPGYAILSMVLSSVVVVLAVASFFIFRHYKLEAEIASMTWRVCACDIKFPNKSYNKMGMNRRGSQVTLYSEDGVSLFEGNRQVFVPTAMYKGSKVAVKAIADKVELSRTLLLELKRLKDIHHDHLARFYGACLDPPMPCVLIEYCPKGSLQDILENDQFKLDSMFRYSLMHDIIKGMSYLHSSEVKSHGNLKSSNCVVDSRFVLKITDFGIHRLREVCREEEDSHAYWRRKLWTAPELLRMGPDALSDGTQKGDVFSFAIIVHEIVTREGPWSGIQDPDMSPYDIVQSVKEGGRMPLRPGVDQLSCEDEVMNLMRRCWAEDPAERPDFSVLKQTIRKLNQDHESGNILDNLLSRMEQYANNLEFLVDERTSDYLEEKRKCEELLYQLLPKSVASQLISGQSVMAETYDSVTIYFSDIVGFTSLSADSTPLQVVDLLNDLYTCFDSIIENFDVYKVETIGDAYMVVSGLPMRNGLQHAREIARMALALLHAVRDFKIRHRPGLQLRLRIGLHSGPCVAGVVGLKMPRYCLFGDTVNTASRMESNGEALRIHVSAATKALLDTFETFELECRGEVEMKGKGRMTTYWLQGEKKSLSATATAASVGASSPPGLPPTSVPSSASSTASTGSLQLNNYHVHLDTLL